MMRTDGEIKAGAEGRVRLWPGIIAAVATLLAAGLAAMALHFLQAEPDLRLEVARKADAVAGSLAEKLTVASEAGIPLAKLRGLEDALETLVAEDPDVVFASVTDAQRQIIATAGKREGEDLVATTISLGREGEPAGAVEVALESPGFLNLFTARLPLLLLGAGLAAAALVAYSGLTLRRLLIRRVEALAKQLAQARACPLAPPPGPARGSDEIAGLSQEVETLRSRVATANYVFDTWARIIRDSHVDDEVKHLIENKAAAASLSEGTAPSAHDDPAPKDVKPRAA